MSCHHNWKPTWDNKGIESGWAECSECHDEMRWESLLLEVSEAYAAEKKSMRDMLAKVIDDAEPEYDPSHPTREAQSYTAVIPKDLLNQIRKLLGWDEV
jgi:hypothetical protein